MLTTPHLFFDLDGTLTDPAPGIIACYRHVITELGLAARTDAYLRAFIGPPLRGALAELIGSDEPDRVEAAVALYRDRFGTKGLYENAVYPEIPALLGRLTAAGHQLWIVTSKAQVYAQTIAQHFGFADFFVAIYGAELSGERSNKGELIAHLLQERRIDPRQACMIGDRSHDVIGAKAHGSTAVGVLWGYGSREELAAAGADHIVGQVDELADLFGPPTRPVAQM